MFRDDRNKFLIGELPRSMEKQVDGYNWEEIDIGCSDSSIFHLHNHKQHMDTYLKIVKKEMHNSLVPEKDRLEWLVGILPVPKVLHFTEDDMYEYMLISETPGKISCDSSFKECVPPIVHLLATGLRKIHDVKIEQCPFDQRLDTKIESARKRAQLGLVDEDDFDDNRQGRKAGDLFQELIATRPTQEDLVFTHGDYCLPNIIINKDSVGGFIDWGRAGIADRYQDLALAIRSLARNFGEEYVPLFFKEYGLEKVDQSKIQFYQLLDEFF
jgi:aminoglycoside phosphotransferase